MGYLPPDAPFRPNVDRHGMPRDFATYEWLTYGRVIKDESPARIAFLHGPSRGRVAPRILPSRDTR